MGEAEITEVFVTPEMMSGKNLPNLSAVGTYRFHHKSLAIDTYIKLVEGNGRFLHFGQSALVESNRPDLPIFHRFTWADEFEASVVVYNDPTLYVYEDLLAGWSQGKPQQFAIPAMADIARLIERASHSTINRSLYFGSSAGGFWAMMVAAVNDAPAMVEVPQTDMYHYPVAGHRERLLDRCYRDHGLDPNEFAHRLRVHDWFCHIGKTPRSIHYYQNGSDFEHIESQMNPFIEKMKGDGYDALEVCIYETPGTRHGHMVMPKIETVWSLNYLLDQ